MAVAKKGLRESSRNHVILKGNGMQNSVDIHELNLQMLTDASRLAASKPHEAIEKYGLDEETCLRLSKLSDAEISHVSKTNMSLFLAAVGLPEREGA